MNQAKKKRAWAKVLSWVLAAGLIAGGALVAVVHVASRASYPVRRADAIVVLGARVMPDGELSTTLEHRIETAYAAYEQKLADQFIVCGARGSDEPVTEAFAMAQYLRARGVPESRIHLEDQSIDTEQNLLGARSIMEARGLTSALLVTSDYHMTRALWLSADVGVDVAAYPAPGPDLWHNRAVARLKEALSWTKYFVQRRVLR